MNVQYKLSNGNWSDVAKDRVDEFITRAANWSDANATTIIESLDSGKSVRFGSDWNNLLRIKPAVVKTVERYETNQPAYDWYEQ